MRRQIWLTIGVLAAALLAYAWLAQIRSAATAGIDANRLVRDALLRENRVSYVARVTTASAYGTAGTSSVIVHQGPMERIDTGKGVWSINAGGRAYTHLSYRERILVSDNHSLLSDSDRVKLLLSNYQARCVRLEQIAGRGAYAVVISSRSNSRPGKKLWIDCQNHAILRTDDYSASGQLRSSTKMERVRFEAGAAPTIALPAANCCQTVCESGSSTAVFKGLGFEVTQPSYLPEGYRLDGYHLLSSTCGCRHHTAQLTYTDGLNVISVFEVSPTACCCGVCKTNSCSDRNCGIATMGGVSRGDKSVVVVGDLLPAEIKKIAASVR